MHLYLKYSTIVPFGTGTRGNVILYKVENGHASVMLCTTRYGYNNYTTWLTLRVVYLITAEG